MRQRDDGRRGTEGLLISVRAETDHFELTFDTVRTTGGGTWKAQTFITFAGLPKDGSGQAIIERERLPDFAALILPMLPLPVTLTEPSEDD